VQFLLSDYALDTDRPELCGSGEPIAIEPRHSPAEQTSPLRGGKIEAQSGVVLGATAERTCYAHHRLRQTQSVCAREHRDEAIHLLKVLDCFASLAMTANCGTSSFASALTLRWSPQKWAGALPPMHSLA
jgi:hypothetical protein